MPRGDTLWQRLQIATEPELRKLGEIVGLTETTMKCREVLIEEISADLRAAAGHSIRNLFRERHEFPYKQILIDVADKMAPGWGPWSWTHYRLNDGHSEIEIEETIWRFYEQKMERKIQQLPGESREKLRTEIAEELRQLGYSQALVSQIGAGLVGSGVSLLISRALAYHIAMSTASGLAWLRLWWIGHASITATLGVGALIFNLLYAPALVWWLGNTAYRKTVPATLELIKIRKIRELEDSLGPK